VTVPPVQSGSVLIDKAFACCTNDIGHLEAWRIHLLCSLRERFTCSGQTAGPCRLSPQNCPCIGAHRKGDLVREKSGATLCCFLRPQRHGDAKLENGRHSLFLGDGAKRQLILAFDNFFNFASSDSRSSARLRMHPKMVHPKMMMGEGKAANRIRLAPQPLYRVMEAV
jgi:hypothetical protein